jgi:hypothetical protein
MSSKFLSVEFTGTLQGVNKFFESKGWTFETKHISPNKILVKVPEDLVDEVTFFQGTPFEDENGENTITSFKNIPEKEFYNTAENGFEIIHHKEEKKPQLEEIRKPSVDQTEHKEVKPMNEQGFPSPMVEGCKIFGDQPPVQSEKLDAKENIATAFADAILPSKSPLARDDPFVFLTGRSYLRNFIAASTVLLFVITLFD